jgi:hypothetical protein
VNLSTAQRQALAADIAANPTLAALKASGNLGGLVAHYGAPASPAYIVWRMQVSQDEIMQNGFNWTRVDNLSVGKARVWEWLFNNESRAINPSKANVRAGIDAVWVGTQQDLDVRAAVYTHCKRSATRFEKLFATGTGTDAVPANLGFDASGTVIEGAPSYSDFEGL